MEKEDQERVRAVVEEILAKADMDKITEKQVRKLAAEETGLDLSIPAGKKLVLSVIKKFLDACEEDEAAAAPVPKEDEPEVEEDVREVRAKVTNKGIESEDDQPAMLPLTKRAKQAKTRKAKEEDEEEDDDKDYEEDDEEEEEHGKGKNKSKYEKDEQGNIIVCELSAKRKVVVSQWKGKTLISLREYYEKDGKTLPTSRGISLTAEQFQLLAKTTNDIDAAIVHLQ